MLGASDCQKPGCTDSPSETYNGENGNTLRLCEKCYYELVSGETTLSPIQTKTNIPPITKSNGTDNISPTNAPPYMWHGVIDPETGEHLGTWCDSTESTPNVDLGDLTDDVGVEM